MQPPAWVPCIRKAAWGPVWSLSCQVTGLGGNQGLAWPGIYLPTCEMGRTWWGRGRNLRRWAASAAPVSGAAATWGHVCSLRSPGPRDHLHSASHQSLGVRRPGSSLLLSSGAGLEQEPRGPPNLTCLTLGHPSWPGVPLLDHKGDKSCPKK